LAEQAGDVSPHRMQRLLGEAVWDADKVRDDVRGYVVDELGDPNGVLILDDTGDLKKGNASVGTQRQYTGTAGRIENSQVAVFLAYASRYGYTLIDREVYLPRSWTDDPARCAAAGVPERVRFATKITLARRMLTRAAAAGVPAAWATADEFYGGDRALRRDLQARGMGYVLAVAKSHRVTTDAILGPQRADQITAALSRRAWNRCGRQGTTRLRLRRAELPAATSKPSGRAEMRARISDALKTDAGRGRHLDADGLARLVPSRWRYRRLAAPQLAPLAQSSMGIESTARPAGSGPRCWMGDELGIIGRCHVPEDARRWRVEVEHFGSQVLEPGFGEQACQLVGGRR
jgi:DDE superfamily endonuclease